MTGPLIGSRAANRASLLGALSVLPLLVWWMGWFPGLFSSDSIDQWGQVQRFEFSNTHPAFHTWTMWLVSRPAETPGAVTLVQVLALAAVLALVARRLSELGASTPAAGGFVVVLAALPAVAATTVTLWKDVPFTVALLWVLAELLGLAARPERWGRLGPALRLGLGLALVWLFRHNGFLTVLAVAPMVVWRQRRSPVPVIAMLGTVAGVVASVHLVLYPLTDVDTSVTGVTLFLPDVAASYVHEPQNFTVAETAYLDGYAPRQVWVDRYDCTDAVPLLFDPAFDRGVGAADPARLRRLLIDTYLRDPDTVLGHRWCVARYLVLPWEPGRGYLHRPPWDIPGNDLGVERAPVSFKAYSVTATLYRWVNQPETLWLWWRPAPVLWLALAAMAIAARRGLAGGLAPAIVLLVAHTGNVALTSTAHEFRFAFPIYLMSWVLMAAAVVRIRTGRRG